MFYSLFFLVEMVGVFGVIVVVVVVFIFGNYGVKIGMSLMIKLNINNFWDVVVLFVNFFVFLMVGFEIMRIDLIDKWGLVIMVIVIVFIV